ncbi:hypothetical protein DFH06DRAFT_1256414 [Mycena polygramma]|nr:hypothetical protein DFH06DRAFT_1256414 [Mycena polygramma]
MEQTRESRGSRKTSTEDKSESSRSGRDLPRKPPCEKRKALASASCSQKDRHVLTPWLASMPDIKQPITADQRLHQEIVAYVAYVQPTPQETTARQTLFEVIQKSLQRRFPDGELKMFGSAATGLDMDLVAAEKKRPLFQMSTILKAARITWDVQSLPEYGSFNVDVGINNGDGPRAIPIVTEYLNKMPALRSLILIRNLNNAAYGGLGSLCCHAHLNPSKRPQDYIDKPMETESLGSLVADFMFYYGIEFPYAYFLYFCPEGKLLPKESAEWISNKCLLNPENDVGKSAGRLDAIRSAFKTGYATILQMSLTDTSLLGPLVSLTQSVCQAHFSLPYPSNSVFLRPSTTPAQKPIPRQPKQHRPAQPPPQQPRTHLPPPPPGANLPPRPGVQLPPRPPPLLAPSPPEHVPYGAAFGAGSAMGRGPYTSSGNGSLNRKGSGFAGMRSATPPPAPAPHPRFDPEWPPRGGGSIKTKRTRRPETKRRRVDVGGG